MEKVQQDILILKKVVWHQLLDNDLDSSVLFEIPGLQIVTSNTLSNLSEKPLPKQKNSYDCGLFSVMYLYYMPTRTTIGTSWRHGFDWEVVSEYFAKHKLEQGFKKLCSLACFQSVKQLPRWFEVNHK